jgi:prepilin-type N-terminal cleavage/methylation domain-containing protein
MATQPTNFRGTWGGAPAPARSRIRAAGAARHFAGFTLIELLVVISIIGVLAALTVGLTGLATRKSKESRVRTELTKLASDIENYKSALGMYPPDHPGMPSTNQLFYELSGTLFANNAFAVQGRTESIPASSVTAYFGTLGFSNSARDPKELKFTTEFKPSQYQRFKDSPPLDVLSVPVPGPAYWALPSSRGGTINPWLYVSSSPTNNAERFDLWTEVHIGGKIERISNWETDPVVVQ